MPFSYNPGVNDISGQLRAQGTMAAGNSYANAITSLGNSASRAIESYGAQKEKMAKLAEEEKTTRSLNKALETLLPQYAKTANLSPEWLDTALQSSPDESPRARSQRLAALMEGVVTTQSLKAKQDEARMRAQQFQREQEIYAQQARDRAALRGAIGNGETGDQFGARGGYILADPIAQGMMAPRPVDAQAISSFLAQGGSPRGAADLAQLGDALARMKAQEAAANQPPWSPSMIDLGNGVTSMMTSPRSAVPISKGPPAANANTKTVIVGGRELTVGPGNRYFDDKGQAVDFGEDKPLSVNEFMMSPQLSTKFGDDYGKYREAFTTQKNKINNQPAETPATLPTLEDIEVEKERRRRFWLPRP